MLISFVFTKKFRIIYLIVIICLTFKESLALNQRDTTERINWACESCRYNKKKCDSKQPCNRCSDKNIICQYSSQNKRGRKTDKTTYKVPEEYLLTFRMNIEDEKYDYKVHPNSSSSVKELANIDPENISIKYENNENNENNDYYTTEDNTEDNHFYYLNEIYNLAIKKH